MARKLQISALIGLILGALLWACSFFGHPYHFFISVIICIVFGPLTVWGLKENANIYALVVTAISGLFMLAAYGLENGLIYSLGIAGVYAILSVQFSIALVNSYDNIKFLLGKAKCRK